MRNPIEDATTRKGKRATNLEVLHDVGLSFDVERIGLSIEEYRKRSQLELREDKEEEERRRENERFRRRLQRGKLSSSERSLPPEPCVRTKRNGQAREKEPRSER